MFAYCNNNPIIYVDYLGTVCVYTIPTEIYFSNGDKGEAKLSSYIDNFVPDHIKNKEKKVCHIINKTLDGGAESVVSTIDQKMFMVMGAIVFSVFTGSPIAISIALIDLGLAFLHGASKGLYHAVREEYHT